MPLKMEQIINLGIVIILIGFVVVFFGLLKGAKEPSKAKVAIGGFIGPIPFGFGNDKTLLWFVTVLSLILFLLWLFFSLRFIKVS